MQNMSDTTINSLRLFRTIKICNMKSSWCTKLKKMAKTQIEPDTPLLVVPFLIIFSLGITEKCFLQVLSPSLTARYQGCPAKYAVWAKENSYNLTEWSKTSFWAIFELMNWIFFSFRKRVVWVSCPYSKELSCKNSRKLLQPFLSKTGY